MRGHAVRSSHREDAGAPRCFRDFDASSWFWDRLRDNFPLTYASLLMPNHPHVLCEVECPETARAVFARTCGHLQRKVGIPHLWEPVPPAQVLADAGKARRMARYIVLNGCRANLVDDPLETIWTTHRDVVGAVADPWVDVDRLARDLKMPRRTIREDFHQYCSADPSVSVSGTPFPRPAPPRDMPTLPLALVARAAAMATRGEIEDIHRRTLTRHVFLQLARTQGWLDRAQLATACGITSQAVLRAWDRKLPDFVLHAARLCLGDDRLLGSDASNASSHVLRAV
jgi:hypothetical protein